MQKSELQLRHIQLQTQTLLAILPFEHREASSQNLDKDAVPVPHKIQI